MLVMKIFRKILIQNFRKILRKIFQNWKILKISLEKKIPVIKLILYTFLHTTPNIGLHGLKAEFRSV